MTIRKLITIVEIDAEATECGACMYLLSDTEVPSKYPYIHMCGLYISEMCSKERLPECLASEREEHPPVKLIPCARCADEIACMLVHCTNRCTGECMQLCKRCKIEMMPMPTRDQ